MHSNPRELLEAANLQIRQILALLGVGFSESGRWLHCPCPVHGGDAKSAWNWNLDKGYWVCRTKACQEEHGKDIFGLISGIQSCSRDEAAAWLFENIDECERAVRVSKLEIEKVYPEVCLKRLFKNNYYASKNLSPETLEYFEHGKAESGKMRNRVVFPIRNEKGQIIGFSGRWCGREEIVDGKTVCLGVTGKRVSKWLHVSLKKAMHLFNYYRSKEHSQKFMVVVESIGNTMRWVDAGFRNVVACLGSSISTRQVELLIKATPTVVLAFDNDDAGREGAARSCKRLEEFVDVQEIFPPEGKDWLECSNEEVVKSAGICY